MNMNKRYLPVKRLFDIIFSIFGILLCLGLLWWWILLINIFVTKGHPFFKQRRLGKDKKEFNIIKFRSMNSDSNSNIPPYKISGEEQFNMETWFGHFLRKSQLDETLQFFNILIGDMSFVGPRPGAALNEDELIRARDSLTPNPYLVRPGLTGIAQVTLKDRHNPILKAKCDSEYVSKMSFSLDTKLIFKTIFRLFK